jgi:hypothetical protein
MPVEVPVVPVVPPMPVEVPVVPVVPPVPELVWAEVGKAKGRVVKLRAKVPAKTILDKSEGFIVMVPFNF